MCKLGKLRLPLLVAEFVQEANLVMLGVGVVLRRENLLVLYGLGLDGQDRAWVLQNLSLVQLRIDPSVVTLHLGDFLVLLQTLVGCVTRVLEDLVVVVHVQPLRLRQVNVLWIPLRLA